MQFKKGMGWKACFDEERELYTAERSWRGFYQLCEIDKETFDKLDIDSQKIEPQISFHANKIVSSVDDRSLEYLNGPQ